MTKEYFKFLLIFTLISCQIIDKKEITIDKWNIRFEVPKNSTVTGEPHYDSIFDSNYIKIELPTLYSELEKISFNPEFKIYDKSLTSDDIDNRPIYDFIDKSLRRKLKVLQGQMEPTKYGQNFNFVVQKNNKKTAHNYHLKKLDTKFVFVEYISTYDSRYKNMEKWNDFIKSIEEKN